MSENYKLTIMKELSIEEKAKRYDEAIKRVENINTGKCETTFMFTEGLFEHIFPELKENEDERIKEQIIWDRIKQMYNDMDDAAKSQVERAFPELAESEDDRIRKEMLEFLKCFYVNPNVKAVNVTPWIAWLEKQKHNKFIVEDAYQRGYDKGVKDTLENQSENQKEHNICDTCDYNGICIIPCHAKLIGKQGEQKYNESDDEKIRKALIKLVKKAGEGYENVIDGVSIENAISWLEKQGEQNKKHFELKAGHWYICHRAFCCRADHLTVKEGERFMCEKDGVVKGFVIKEPEKYFKEVCAPAPFEDEQNTADNVEPKFHEGEWLCENEPNNYARFIQILEIVNVQGKERYRISRDLHNDEDVAECRFIENNYHPFTIQDAKDGDLIYISTEEKGIQAIFHEYKNNTVFFHCYLCRDFEQGGYMPIGSVELVYPLQKEHYKRFFEKMHEAGYEWDGEKKELKKIEQKPAWSEEDENMLQNILECLRHGWKKTPTDILNYENWLKSLRPQSQWKPSEGQMDKK